MAHQLSKVRIGDWITAEAFNALVEAAQQSLHLSAAFPLVLERTPGGILLRLANQTHLKFVELEDDLAEGDTDRTGHVLDYDAATPQWVNTTTTTGYSPQLIERLTDPLDAGLYLAGERRVVYFDRESGRHLPLSGPGPHLAKTAESIDRDSSGTVIVQKINSEGESEATELELTAYNWSLPRVWEEVPCFVALHPQSRRWYLTQAFSATLVLAAVNAAGGVNETDATFDVNGVIPLNGSYPDSMIEGVRNTFQHEFDDDATVALVWNDESHLWETIQGLCPASGS
jgi:hypothetical protein